MTDDRTLFFTLNDHFIISVELKQNISTEKSIWSPLVAMRGPLCSILIRSKPSDAIFRTAQKYTVVTETVTPLPFESV